jgi:uncharacterized protein (DUF362 family)
MTVAAAKWTGSETVSEALEAIDAWQDFSPGMKVLIKPNAVMGGSPKVSCKGITTSPEIVREVARIAREKGAESIVIAEGSVELPSLKLDTSAAFQWSGIQSMAEELDILLVDLNKGPYRTFTLSDGTEIEIAEILFEADFVINMPVLKTHNQTITTVCLKNLKGCLAMESKKKCHIETDLNRAIAEFNQFIPCHLNVVDALTATEIGPTPTGKEDQAKEMGLVLASKDRFACDIVGSYLLGYRGEEVPHLVHYASLAGRSLEMDDVQVLGEDPAAYRMSLPYVSEWVKDLMEKFDVSGMTMPHYGDTVCSACGFNLWAGLFTFFRANPGVAFPDVELCTGKGVTPSSDAGCAVLLGKCAIERNKGIEGIIKVPGCPPDPGKLAEILTKKLLTEQKA